MRDHSELELRRKLSALAETEDQLDVLFAELRSLGYLSDERFARNLAARRAERYGSRRIAHELEGHQVGDQLRGAVLDELAQTERERAMAAWQKRFGRAPADFAERGKHYRFLAQRGFDGEAIAWVLRQAVQVPIDDE